MSGTFGMFAKKTVLAATALAAMTAMGLGAAQAQAPDRYRAMHQDVVHHDAVRHDVVRHDVHRPYVARNRVFATLRAHRYVGLGDPYFFHGRYVVRSHDRFGHVVLVQVDPWTGAYIGVVRV